MQIFSFSTIVLISLAILISFIAGSWLLVDENKNIHHAVKK